MTFVNGTQLLVPGPAGASEYQIWLGQGNVGTEADFLTSRIGPAGAPGLPGSTGAPGAPGIIQSFLGVSKAAIAPSDVLASNDDAANGTATSGLMTPDLTRRHVSASISSSTSGTIGAALSLKAGIAGPAITFNRAQAGSIDALLRDLVWQQGRSVIEFDPTAMSKSGNGGAALAEAVAALPDQGGVVLIPPMDQGSALNLTGTTLVLSKPNVAIVGAGNGLSNAILTQGHNQDIISAPDGLYTPTLAGFTITVYGTTGTTPYYLFNGSGAISTRFSDISADGLHSFANVGGALGRYKGCRVRNLKPVNGVGFRFLGPQSSEQQQVIDCDFENAPGQDPFAAVYIGSGSSFEFTGVQAKKMGSPLVVQPTSGSTVFSVVLIDWWSDTSSGIGMLLDGTNGVITRVESHASWFSSCNLGVQVSGNVWGAKLLNGTKIYDNYSDGARIASGATLKSFAIDGAMIAGNGVRQGGNLGTGVNVLGSTADFDIRNTSFSNDADFGTNTYADIAIGSGVDSYSINSNRFGRADGRSPVIGHTTSASRIATGNRGWSA